MATSSTARIEWNGPYTFLKEETKQKNFSEYNTTKLDSLISQFPSIHRGKRHTEIQYISSGERIYGSPLFRELISIFNKLKDKELSLYTKDEICEILKTMEEQSCPVRSMSEEEEESNENDDGDHSPAAKRVRREKVFTEKQAAIMSRCFFEYISRYNLLKQNKYSNDTVKHFIRAVCELSIMDIPNLSVDISTTNHTNQILYLKINSKFKVGKQWKDTIIHGVPDVAITDNQDKKKKFLIGEGESVDDLGTGDEKGVGQLMLATLVAFIDNNNPILGFLLSPEKIVLYKVWEEPEEFENLIKVEIIYEGRNSNEIDDFFVVAGLIKREIEDRIAS